MLSSGNTDPVHQGKPRIGNNSDNRIDELSDGVEMLQSFEDTHVYGNYWLQDNDLSNDMLRENSSKSPPKAETNIG